MGKLAVIPARGGSKRIPKKNIKEFLGKPIIAYSIEAALKSNLFDDVMVSTDCEKIAEIAKEYGATVPFLRSSDNANDFAVLADVVEEVVIAYKNLNLEFESVCCILPTAPFVTPTKIKEALVKLHNDKLETVFPVIEFSFPIQRALKFVDCNIEMVNEHYLNSRSQDLESRFHDSGQFYWINTKQFLIHKKLFSKNSGAIIISELESQDIDTETDWKLAEIKYKMMLNNEKNYM